MTQVQLAEKTGLTVKYISNIECSVSFPSASVIASIAKALSIPQYRLFIPDNPKQDDKSDAYISKDVMKREINKLFSELLSQL